MHAGVAEFVVKMHGFCGFQNLAFRNVDDAVMTQIFTGFVDPACFFEFLFYEDFGWIWGTLWGTILVKNQEKCVAKTGLREVVKMVRKKRRF